jgi:hypothetical protein
VRHRLDVHAAFGRGDDRDAADRTVDQQREVELAFDVAAFLDISRFTVLPAGPVCLVTRSWPSMAWALAPTSSIDLQTRTPPLPLGSSLKRPLPRPPAWICALTTTTGVPSLRATSMASSRV